MNDDQLKQASVPILHFPMVLGAAIPAYNLPGVPGDLNFTPEALSGIFLGKVTKWNDPSTHFGEPGSKAARRRYRRRASLGRQRHYLHLDRLPGQGQSRMAIQGRARELP